MKSRKGKRVLLSGIASIGLIAAGIGLSGCGGEEPSPPTTPSAAPASIDAHATKKATTKGKQAVDTSSRQERQKQRAAEKAGG
ncbi:hypothetical protein [Paludisphaera borealis]|uniref:Uncharacterized protein n=1 Tax=Paludisphaera borealis TaxID=1387353 RepID=A0A1U7CP25_9BACT|nr:hypothetical protein [Paludisphaera borealis]APW60690.1 hypothetical protein BSF38_02178 [Paludisphaera borealis]